MSAVSLTLGMIHLFVWVKYRSQLAHLLFFVLATSATAVGAFELAMTHAPSAAAYAGTLRWAHVPLAIVVLSIVWFVYFHLRAGRLWLAWAACGFRLLGLTLNFLTGVNINFSEVTTLERMLLWGDAVVVGPVGITNPWAVVPQIGNLLLITFVIDASITLWRRGGPTRAGGPPSSVAASSPASSSWSASARLITLGLGARADDAPAWRVPDRAGHGLRTRLGPDRGGAAGRAPARQRDALPRGRRGGAECDPADRRPGAHRTGQCACRNHVRLPARAAAVHARGPAGAGTLSRYPCRPARPAMPSSRAPAPWAPAASCMPAARTAASSRWRSRSARWPHRTACSCWPR